MNLEENIFRWIEHKEHVKKTNDWRNASAAIASKIEKEMQSKRLTLEDLSKELCISKRHMKKILAGKENLSLEMLIKIKNALSLKLFHIDIQTVMDEMDR